jgi:DNA-binding transcriptional LysR family regulator
MNIDALAIFVEVAEAGSFAAVARRRDLDPSAVSRVIAALEEELGFRLFQRTTRRLSPTEAGAIYFERIRGLVEDVDRARAEARDRAAGPSGNLRVTASASFGLSCIVPTIAAFRRRYPDLALDVRLTDNVVDLVGERIDVAVRLGPRPEGDFICTRLMTTRYRVCVAPAYLESVGRPERPEDLEVHRCLLFPLAGYRTRWRFRDRQGRRVDIPVKGDIVISNAMALHRAALDGLGPALLADWLVDEDLAAGRLIDLFPDCEVTAADFDTAAWILYPSRAYVPMKVRVFIDHLKATVPRRARDTRRVASRPA